MSILSMEHMVPYSGRHSAKQTNRAKNKRFGYKIFWITTKTGFPIHCIPYAGKNGICGQSGKDLTARVVLQLVLTGGISDTDFLFFDNWYAGYKILAILTALDIRTQLPLDKIDSNSRQAKLREPKQRERAKLKFKRRSIRNPKVARKWNPQVFIIRQLRSHNQSHLLMWLS